MQENFQRAWEFIKRWDGGYSNDPKDPGGETRFGITKRDHETLDIKNLTEETARGIFYHEYWQPAQCDTIPYPLDIIVADTAFNVGPQRATSWFPEVAVNNVIHVDDYLFRRIAYYCSLKAGLRARFLTGWINRVLDLRKYCEG